MNPAEVNLIDVYDRCYAAKDKYPDSFTSWIREFLHFAPSDLLRTDLKRFEKIMSSNENTVSNVIKKLHKYSATQYIFYYIDHESPEKMTNYLHLSEDAEHWVKFFNIDFFNIGNPKLVLYSFVEGLNLACEEADINYLDVSKKIFKLYYDLNDFEEAQFGPPKSRFFEYYRQKTGETPGKNPNQTLIIPESFFQSFEPNKRERLEKLLISGEVPTNDDYKEVIEILGLEGKKGKRLWTDDNFSIYRSNDRSYIYLVREEDSKVWKVYNDKTPVKDILNEYKELVE